MKKGYKVGYSYEEMLEKMREDEKKLYGMTLDQVRKEYPDVRVERIDGEAQNLNADYKPNRLNVCLVDGKVVSLDWF